MADVVRQTGGFRKRTFSGRRYKLVAGLPQFPPNRLLASLGDDRAASPETCPRLPKLAIWVPISGSRSAQLEPAASTIRSISSGVAERS